MCLEKCDFGTFLFDFCFSHLYMNKVLHFFEKMLVIVGISALLAGIGKFGLLYLANKKWFGATSGLEDATETSNIIFAIVFCFFIFIFYYLSQKDRPKKSSKT